VKHIKTKGMRKCNKMIHLNLHLHLHKRTMTTSTKKRKMMMRKPHHNPSKSYLDLEQELTRIIPSNKYLEISNPGESLALNLV
jgi:hypothetical protein